MKLQKGMAFINASKDRDRAKKYYGTVYIKRVTKNFIWYSVKLSWRDNPMPTRKTDTKTFIRGIKLGNLVFDTIETLRMRKNEYICNRHKPDTKRKEP